MIPQRLIAALQFDWNRHVVALAGASLMLFGFLHGHPVFLLPDDFHLAMYGALHAICVVIAARRNSPLWRSIAFIVGSGLLTVVLAEFGVGVLSSIPGMTWTLLPPVVAAVGACCYTALVRQCWAASLPTWTVVASTLFCAAALIGVGQLAMRTRFLHELTTISWWMGCSLGLWLGDRFGAPRARSTASAIA